MQNLLVAQIGSRALEVGQHRNLPCESLLLCILAPGAVTLSRLPASAVARSRKQRWSHNCCDEWSFAFAILIGDVRWLCRTRAREKGNGWGLLPCM
jgi:hypothetical protein